MVRLSIPQHILSHGLVTALDDMIQNGVIAPLESAAHVPGEARQETLQVGLVRKGKESEALIASPGQHGPQGRFEGSQAPAVVASLRAWVASAYGYVRFESALHGSSLA